MANGVLGEIPSSGYNPARIAIDPNDPDYLKKMAMVGALEGHHEMNAPSMQPVTGELDPMSAKSAAEQYEREKPPAYPTEGAKMTPYETSLGITPATTRLMHKAEGIQSKPLRVLGEIGAGTLRGLEGVGTAMFPGVAAAIPGSQLNTEMKRRGALEQTQAQQAQDIEREKIQATEAEKEAELGTREALGELTAGTREDISKRHEAAATERTDENIDMRKLLAMEKPNQAVYADLMFGDNGQARVNPTTGKPYTSVEAFQATSTQKPSKPAAGTVNGQPAFARDAGPGQGWVDVRTGQQLPDFKPALTWSQAIAPTRTIDVLDPDTKIPYKLRWNTNTNNYDIPVGISPSGTFAHQIEQAGFINRAGDELIQDVLDRYDKVGNLDAILKSAFLNTPLADPEQKYLAAKIGSFAALQPGMHQMRGTQAYQHFVDLIGGIPTDPQALIRGIQGIQSTASQALSPEAAGKVSPVGGGGNKGTPAKTISLDDFLKEK